MSVSYKALRLLKLRGRIKAEIVDIQRAFSLRCSGGQQQGCKGQTGCGYHLGFLCWGQVFFLVANHDPATISTLISKKSEDMA